MKAKLQNALFLFLSFCVDEQQLLELQQRIQCPAVCPVLLPTCNGLEEVCEWTADRDPVVAFRAGPEGRINSIGSGWWAQESGIDSDPTACLQRGVSPQLWHLYRGCQIGAQTDVVRNPAFFLDC
jgi:hypothetical protein